MCPCSTVDFFPTAAGICRRRSVRCQHCKEQSVHCSLEDISHSSTYSVLPMLLINSFEFSLNWLNFLSLVQTLHQRVTVRVCIKLVDQFLHHFCDHRLLSGLLSVVDVGFWNLCYRFESPRTSREESHRTPRFVCFGGRRMLSLFGIRKIVTSMMQIRREYGCSR